MHLCIHVCILISCTYTRVFTCTHTDTCVCVCLPLHDSVCRLSAQVIGSRVVQLFVYAEDLECFTAAFAAARRELQNLTLRITAFPSRRAAAVLFFFPCQRRFMSQIATGWVFIATCGSFRVCRSRSPKVNLPVCLSARSAAETLETKEALGEKIKKRGDGRREAL